MPRTDFNGDGRDDILWRNSQSGVVISWLGQSDGGFVYNDAAGMDPWAIGRLVGIGDIDADGRSDTLWHSDNGELYLSQTFPDGAFYFHWSLGFVARVSTDWNVIGMGDFNGDGRDDILWRSDSGIVTDWLSNGGYVFSNNHANSGQAIPTDWQVVGTADFNGDGRDDLLWRHDNGTVTNWLGQANGGFANNHSNTGQAIPIDWQVVGTGDFNGDGFGDVLWRHAEGTVTDWLGQANGGFVNNHANSAQAMAIGWQVVGSGDYDGDGRSDVLWRHENGALTDWLGQANGGFVSNTANADYGTEAVWQIQPNLSGAGMWDY